MKEPRRNPDGAYHEPMPSGLAPNAPITVTGYAAEEVRRLARLYGGLANEPAVTRLAAAAVMRGIAILEPELAATHPHPTRIRDHGSTNDEELTRKPR